MAFERQEKGNALTLINSMLPSLRPSLMKVGQYIIENKDRIADQSIDDLGLAANVSKASVVRFCKTLGFSGFREFKIRFTEDVVRQKTAAEVITNQAKVSEVFTEQIESIRNTWDVLDPKEFDSAVDMLSSARQIIWFGVGASGYLANWVNYKAGMIGANSKAVDSYDLFRVLEKHLSPDDVVVCFTRSGSTPVVAEIMGEAKKLGVKLIVITNYENSPLAKLADIRLITADHQFTMGAQTISFRSAHSAVANALLTQLVKRMVATPELEQALAHVE